MIVSKSRLDEAQRKEAAAAWAALTWRMRYSAMLNKYNELVTRINEHGGEALFSQKPAQSQFTQDEIEKLIRLCHPDKHNNSATANELTARLLKLRGKVWAS